MSKIKLAVIGRGTAGAYGVSHFLKSTKWEIDWYFDAKQPPQAVGEGSTLEFPIQLFHNMGFTYSDLEKIDGTPKLGIQKSGWGRDGAEFMHWFSAGFNAYHFNANKLQDYILDYVQASPRVKIIDQRVTSYDDIDATYILDCSGKPGEDDRDQFVMSDYIPVNSVHVTQCYWDVAEFHYSLNLARKHGWVFGIPLRNRCSIGYLYNNNISTLYEIKEDVQEVFGRYRLTPSDHTNTFNFRNYYRKQNFYPRLCYNGNASYFLEPIEATSIYFMDIIQWAAEAVWKEGKHYSLANIKYERLIKEMETMIMFHYFKNQVYETEFWQFATERGVRGIKKSLAEDPMFRGVVTRIVNPKWEHPDISTKIPPGYATWAEPSFHLHMEQLDVRQELIQLLEDTKDNNAGMM